ncbi:glycosyltransferase family 2 protein [Chloroflexota bacterium]
MRASTSNRSTGTGYKPLVSVITPVYNYERFVEHTLLSVKNQSYPNIEHIVIDDGSTDNSFNIVKKYENTYNLICISKPNEGQSATINRGFNLAKGEIITWLNADDVYFHKNAISWVVEQFRRFPDADVIYGEDVCIDAENNILAVRRVPDWSYSRMRRGRFCPSSNTTFYRKEVIKNHHLREDLKYTMDLEFYLRLGKDYLFKHTRRILAGTRIHSGRKQISRRRDAREEDRVVMAEYGQKFDLKYSLLRQLDRVDRLLTSRLLAVLNVLEIWRDLPNLAFDGKWKSTWALFWRQVLPGAWIRL